MVFVKLYPNEKNSVKWFEREKLLILLAILAMFACDWLMNQTEPLHIQNSPIQNSPKQNSPV